jgi:hypothetical protein
VIEQARQVCVFGLLIVVLGAILQILHHLVLAACGLEHVLDQVRFGGVRDRAEGGDVVRMSAHEIERPDLLFGWEAAVQEADLRHGHDTGESGRFGLVLPIPGPVGEVEGLARLKLGNSGLCDHVADALVEDLCRRVRRFAETPVRSVRVRPSHDVPQQAHAAPNWSIFCQN